MTFDIIHDIICSKLGDCTDREKLIPIFEILRNDNIEHEEAAEKIKTIFNYHKSKKEKNILYSKNDYMPETIIASYFTYINRSNIRDIYEHFKEKYIYNENELEQIHEKAEIDGMSVVYDFITDYTDYDKINIYTLLNIHQKLFSLVPYSEVGGKFREQNSYLLGNSVSLTDYRLIPREIQKLYIDSINLTKFGLTLRNNFTAEDIIDYIDKAVELMCKIIKIHPFFDGNGRSARALLNVYFKVVDIPPVYVTYAKREEYLDAMGKAIKDNDYGPDYSSIKKFYYYKICDSLVELDISKNKNKCNVKKLIK